MNKTIEYYVNLPHKITLKKWTDEEESYYVVQIPELPGCMSDGETIKEALKNIIDAKTGWVDACLYIGREVPIPENTVPIIENLGDYTKEEIEDVEKACIELREIMDKFYEKHKDVTFLSNKRKKILMNLGDLINTINVGQVVKANFANKYWYITKTEDGFIRMCDEKGIPWKNIGAIPLTYTNLNADYRFI